MEANIGSSFEQIRMVSEKMFESVSRSSDFWSEKNNHSPMAGNSNSRRQNLMLVILNCLFVVSLTTLPLTCECIHFSKVSLILSYGTKVVFAVNKV